MVERFNKRVGRLAVTLMAMSPLTVSSCFPDSPFLDQGIKDYTGGDYLSALEHLEAAETSDFDKPLLHYYLANTYLQLHEEPHAVREYKIAYALKPDGELSGMCKRALSHYKIDTANTLPLNQLSSSGGKPGITTSAAPDPIVQQALALLQKELDDAKKSNAMQAQSLATNLGKNTEQRTQLVQKHTQDLIDLISPGHPMRFWHESDLNESANSTINALRRDYESQRRNYQYYGNAKTAGMQESAKNLTNLLMQKPGSDGTKLTPAGTNLYIRNYEHSKANPHE
jgi:tetratricopeptide (TPR) repeat protein